MTVLDMNSRLVTRARIRSRSIDHTYRRSEGLDFGDTLDNVVARNVEGFDWVWRVIWLPLTVAMFGFVVCVGVISMRAAG